MILGAIPLQIIKLMAMQGIPWTKVWAMMFGISIVFGEVLILLVRALSLDDGSADEQPAWRRHKLSDALVHIDAIPFSLQFAFSWGITAISGITIIFEVVRQFVEEPGSDDIGLIVVIVII
jgi:hypothetical protein